MELVERESALQTLRRLLEAASARGRVALVAGEAGIGKTSLVRTLASTHDTVWWGACDALQTPHPLAPLLDIARDTKARFAKALAGPRPALFEAVLDDLSAVVKPVLMVIEDAHWADEATFDLLKFLGRRIDRTRALLVVSFRDDEVGVSHPLRRVIGELPPSALTRIDLPRLSPAGVETLARRALRAPEGLYAATHGNPFFVTELLRHPVDALPRTVQDLVLARFARLQPPAQAIVRLASIVPAQIERWLVDALLTPRLSDLEACLDSGLLLADAAALRFRHELARVAVESTLSPPAAQALHAQVLRALTADGRALPAARLAHHATLAGDEAAVRVHVPAAADDARARGAHREAVRHYRSVLQQAGSAPEDERRRWLEAFAEECQFIDRHEEAVAARLELDASFARARDVVGQARNLSRLALLHVFMLRNSQADAASRRAIEMLEPLPPSAALAAAYGIESGLRMLNRDCAESVAWGNKAIALAREFNDRYRLCASLTSVGTATMFIDYERGCRQIEEALQLALADGFPVLAGNAMQNLGSGSGELMRLVAAEQWLRKAVSYAGERELDDIRHYASAWLALCEVHMGNWADAAQRASDVAARAGTSTISRVMALVALGRLRIRRGDPGIDEALDEALALAGGADTLQRIAPVRAARAEAAFARGDRAAAAAEAQASLPLALHHRHSWFIGELAFWCWRGGVLDAPPPDCAEPYALQIGGHWREAASMWQRMGCPYEQARALADGDAEAQQEALVLFDRLGAAPAADNLRRQLREAGVRGLVRGPRSSTRNHPFGLTSRELQVLQLLCDGLRNAEIARQLRRSVRTVDHHLAAVFAKLGVDSRVAAIQAAQRAGLIAQSGQTRKSN
jgi:ATP/maltotriose-dependent transcriptional regulator MalT